MDKLHTASMLVAKIAGNFIRTTLYLVQVAGMEGRKEKPNTFQFISAKP